jgi:hypothetical protein
MFALSWIVVRWEYRNGERASVQIQLEGCRAGALRFLTDHAGFCSEAAGIRRQVAFATHEQASSYTRHRHRSFVAL